MTSIKKVLVLIPDLNVAGGVNNYYLVLNLDQEKEIDYFVINKRNKSFFSFTALRLVKIYIQFIIKISFHNYQTIVSNPSLNQRSFFRDSIFVGLSLILGKKTIVFFRGWSEDFEKKILAKRTLNLVFKLTYSKVRNFIILGNIFKEKLIKLGVNSEAVFYLETTIADSSYLEKIDLDKKLESVNEEINILFLSRIIKGKGSEIAVDAYNLFKKANPKVNSNLFIAGDGPELTHLKDLVYEKEIDHISFFGHVSGAQKYDLLLKSHILLFPSQSEGLPNVILESMLYGLVIISSKVGGIPEIVKHNKNGYLIGEPSANQYADYIEKVVSDKLIFGKISRFNHSYACDQFTTEKVKTRIIKIFTQS